ncbi:ATP-binding protein [Polyangium jinanense]|uniref:histidine kinase n=1 Tax=Polyangium jinanense TaxID=2829994 RepID=A0A9X4AU87_9BACT|nr:ATP-binding protein [Polyangium jinanense]MDC3957531.1 GAF domain-containing protein [Polyangium jinanense]MDC3984979.1 GAF domain-containing protein [Polyangium jinanense]
MDRAGHWERDSGSDLFFTSDARSSVLREESRAPARSDETHACGARRRLACLEEITIALLTATGEDAVAKVILELGAAALGASAALVAMVEDDALVILDVRGMPEETLAQWRRHPLDVSTPLATAVRTRAPVFIETEAEWSAAFPDAVRAMIGPRGPRIALPLIVGDRVLGGIGFCFPASVRFTEDDRALAVTLGRQCALALDRARLFDAERKTRAELSLFARRLDRLQHTTAALAAATTPLEVARAVVGDARAALAADRAVLAIPTPDGQSLVVLEHEGAAPWASGTPHPSFPLDANIPLTVTFRTGERLWLSSKAAIEARFVPASWGGTATPGSLLGFPLVARGRTIGVLLFGWGAEGAPDVDGASIAEEIVHRSAVALDRAMLHAAFEHENRTLTAFTAACPVAAMILDRDGTVRVWNPAAERMFGWSAAEAVGRFLPITDKRHETEAFIARVAGGEVLSGIEVERRHKLGHTIDMSLYSAPVVHGDGTVQCLSICMDIRERKQAEAELRRAYEIARDADRRKDEFLALLGHELRNPLSPILTALYLMRLKGRTSGIEREREVIERQVQHLVALVDDLLDVSRIMRGKIQLSTRPMEIARVFSQAIEIASPLFEQKRHELRVDVPAEGLVVDVDETRMAQVLANLLTNAARYTEAGGHIAVAARREGAEVILSVRDDGSGIPSEMLPVIFDLFVQGARGADRAGGGLGLGLGLVRSLVKLHGGTVSAHSDGPGRGSEFEVRLPALSPRRASSPDLPAPVSLRLSKVRRVLVVDDNRDAAQMLAEVLASHGHEVELAHDGPQALAVAASFRPEVGILDIGLPVMDGYELALELRAAYGDRIMLVAVTGYGQEHDKRRAFEAGFSRHYVKPVAADALLREVLP